MPERKNDDIVLMKHPTTPENDPSEIPFSAYRDCWQALGWELVTDEDEAVGKTAAEELSADSQAEDAVAARQAADLAVATGETPARGRR